VIVKNKEDWLTEYRKDKFLVWIWVTISDNRYGFNEYEDWYTIKKMVEEEKSNISMIQIQLRSNIVSVDTSDCDGVYYVRSVLGRFGEESIDTTTIGKIYGADVKKTVWINKGLVQRDTYEDSLQDCFEEACVIWKT
jgi:hypothetical protein